MAGTLWKNQENEHIIHRNTRNSSESIENAWHGLRRHPQGGAAYLGYVFDISTDYVFVLSFFLSSLLLLVPLRICTFHWLHPLNLQGATYGVDIHGGLFQKLEQIRNDEIKDMTAIGQEVLKYYQQNVKHMQHQSFCMFVVLCVVLFDPRPGPGPGPWPKTKAWIYDSSTE